MMLASGLAPASPARARPRQEPLPAFLQPTPKRLRAECEKTPTYVNRKRAALRYAQRASPDARPSQIPGFRPFSTRDRPTDAAAVNDRNSNGPFRAFPGFLEGIVERPPSTDGERRGEGKGREGAL